MILLAFCKGRFGSWEPLLFGSGVEQLQESDSVILEVLSVFSPSGSREGLALPGLKLLGCSEIQSWFGICQVLCKRLGWCPADSTGTCPHLPWMGHWVGFALQWVRIPWFVFFFKVLIELISSQGPKTISVSLVTARDALSGTGTAQRDREGSRSTDCSQKI